MCFYLNENMDWGFVYGMRDIGRWSNKKEERLCLVCNEGQIEKQKHIIMLMYLVWDWEDRILYEYK